MSTESSEALAANNTTGNSHLIEDSSVAAASSDNNQKDAAIPGDKSADASSSTQAPVSDDKPETSNSSSDSAGDSSKDLNPASAVHGGREISNKILYIGNLHKSIDEGKLIEIFSEFGSVKSAKVLNDKNKLGCNYAFLEFNEPEPANAALTNLNGENLNDLEIKINWAYHSSNANSVQSAQPVYNIFVGDLSPEVDDEALNKHFSQFKSLKEAHVMWDMQTSRSRGYGFVTFLNQDDAELALKTMNGQKILGRNIRCNWASHKQTNFKKGRKLNLNNPNMIHSIQPGQFQNHPLHAPPPHPLQQQPLQMGPMLHPMQGHPPPPPHMQGGPGGLQNQASPHGGDGQPQGGTNSVPMPALPGSTFNMQMPGSMQLSNNVPRGGSNQLFQGHGNQNTTTPQGSQVPFTGRDQNLNNELVSKFDDLELNSGNMNANVNSTSNITNSNANNGMPMMSPQSYDIVLRQTPNWQTTVYLGNIAHFSQQSDILPILQNLGYIVDFKFHPEKGCAFVKYDTHERAALAIVQLAGFNINGRPLKCGWGKDKPPQYRNVPPMYSQRP